MSMSSNTTFRLAAVLRTLVLVCCCLGVGAQSQGVAAAPLPVDIQQMTPSLGLAADLAKLQHLYSRSERALLWYQEDRADQVRIDALRESIELAVQQGLPAQRYWPLLATVENSAQRDLMLSAALLRLVSDLGDGLLIPGEGDKLWNLPAPAVDSVALAWSALQAPDLRAHVMSLAPQTPQYRALVAHYQQLQRQLHGGTEPAFMSAGVVLKPGEQSAEVVLLRQRLAWLANEPADPLASATAPDLYDEPLVALVRRFQQQNGLEVDGVIGHKTLQELNRPLQERLLQVATNLERWRWIPRELGARYILVSTAGYELNLVEDNQVVMETRVISGRPKRPTPSFSSDLNQLTVNPTWTVPRRIMREDLVPQIQRDPEWLAAHSMQVQRYEEGRWRTVSSSAVDWSNQSGLRLKQAPGEKNSLGRLKFGMDNPYAIYLHDTPAQSLFEKPVRSFSSGCIRVEGIAALVEYLLRDDPSLLDWYTSSMAQDQTRVRRLPEPVPVYLVYLSTWVDVEGQIHFMPDIYGLDRDVQAKLAHWILGQVKNRQMAVN